MVRTFTTLKHSNDSRFIIMANEATRGICRDLGCYEIVTAGEGFDIDELDDYTVCAATFSSVEEMHAVALSKLVEKPIVEALEDWFENGNSDRISMEWRDDKAIVWKVECSLSVSKDGKDNITEEFITEIYEKKHPLFDDVEEKVRVRRLGSSETLYEEPITAISIKREQQLEKTHYRAISCFFVLCDRLDLALAVERLDFPGVACKGDLLVSRDKPYKWQWTII